MAGPWDVVGETPVARRQSKATANDWSVVEETPALTKDDLPTRDAGTFGLDVATRIRQGTNNVVGGILGLPVDVANLVTEPLRLAQRGGNALRGSLGMDALPVLGAMQQPDVVRGIRESLAINNAGEDSNLSPTALTQAQEFQSQDGIIPSMKYLLGHPGYAATEAAAQLPQFLQIAPGSTLGTVALQGASAASQNTQQIVDDLRAQGMPEGDIASRAADAYAPSLAVNTVLPYVVPFGTSIDRMLAGQAGKSAARAGAGKLGMALKPMLGETVVEGGQEGLDQVTQNVATGHPLMDQVGQNVALGALIGAPGGLAAGAHEAFAQQPHAGVGVADASPSNAIDPAILAAGNAALQAAPDARKARAEAGLQRNADVLGHPGIAAEPTDDLNALIAKHLPPEVLQAALNATPEQQAQALATLGDLVGEAQDPNAPYRRPESAPTATPAAPAPDGVQGPSAQTSFAQQAAAAMRMRAQSASATRTTPTTPDVQPAAEPAGSRPVAGDLAADSQRAASATAPAGNQAPDRNAGVPAHLVEAAKTAQARSRAASDVLNAFPKGAMGITPDAVKATPEFIAARAEMSRALAAERNANDAVVKARKAAKSKPAPVAHPQATPESPTPAAPVDDTPPPPLDIRYGKKRAPPTREQLVARDAESQAKAAHYAPHELVAEHEEAGQPGEPATPAIVAESVQKSADNTPRDLKEARGYLLAKIDEAIAAAPKAASMTFRQGHNKASTAQNRMERLAANGHITFDVPGDGKFKVVNTDETLAAFREKVRLSKGFDAKGKPHPVPSKPSLTASATERAKVMAEAETVNEPEAAPKEAGKTKTAARENTDQESSDSTIESALSRAQGEADAKLLGLDAAVRKVLGDQASRVEYVHDYAGLPENLRTGIEKRNAERKSAGGVAVTGAVYDPHSQRVFIITSVVRTPDRAVWNSLHEIAGHDGLRKLLGAKLDPALTIALQNQTVKKLAEAIHADRKMDVAVKKGDMTAHEARMLAAEEALAELQAAIRTGNYDFIAERYGVTIGDGIRTEQSLKAAIANFLKRLKALLDDLFGSHVFLDEDVRQLLDAALVASRDEATTGKPSILESVEDSRDNAEARRNEVAGTLPVARGSAGWDYGAGKWIGRKGQVSNTRAHLQDKMLAWRDVQGQIESKLQAAIPDAQNVYRLENLMHGRVSEGIDRIEREQVKPLMEAMRAAGVKPDTLEEYLYARHAAERNAQIAGINPAMPDGGSGMMDAEAANILAGAAKATLDPLARKVDGIAKATRKRLLAHGLITQEAFDAMEAQYQHYVPLRGQTVSEDVDFGGTGMAGRGLDSRGKMVREALGRGAGNRAQHILGEIIGDAERSVILAEKARVGRAVMRIVLANPNPSLWQVEPVQTERALDANGEVYEKVVNDWSDPSVVAVRHKGQLFKVQINSVPLAQALNNIGIDRLGQITRYAGAVNRYFSAILTKYNPAFTPVNATRDALFGLTGLAAEHGELAALDAALHYPQAAAAAFQQARGKKLAGEWGDWADEFAANGGKTGYVNMPSAEDIARKIGSGSLTSYSPDGMLKAARAIGDAVGTLNDAVENALRLSAYVTLRKRGSSPEASAAYAKDLTVNFNRKGFDGSTWNAWFLFFNASMQGAHRVSKLLRKPKTYAYLGMLAGAQVLATMAAMGMRDDNDEPLWNKVPDHIKRRNIVIVTKDGGIITIPMPYGFNLLPYVAGRITEATMNADRGEHRASDRAAQLTADTMSAAIESFSPVPLDDGVAGLLPTVLRIPANVWANKNDFGNRIRNEAPYAKSDVPRASMGKPDTLEVFKLTAKGLNRIGGGDDLTPPPMSAFDVAPEDLEYLLGELTGGPGNLVTDIATSWQKATGGDYAQDLTARDIPITRRFVSNIDEQASQQVLFYDRREVIDRSLKRVRLAFKAQGPEAAEALLRASPELKGAAFKRRKGGGRHGEPPGSIIVSNGGPQIIASDEGRNRGTHGPVRNPGELSVYGAYKAAEDAIQSRNDAVDTAFAVAPAGLLPTARSRDRDAAIRTENRIRQAAQSEFNAAWVRDVVGSAE